MTKYLPISIQLKFQLRISINLRLTESSLNNRFWIERSPKMGFWGRGEDIWWGSPRTECLRREGFSPLCTVYSLKPIVTQWCVWGLIGDVIISCTISAQSVQGLGSYGTPNFPISYSSSSLYWQKCNRAERTKKGKKTLLSNCKNTIIHRQNQMTFYTTNYIDFSTIKKRQCIVYT